MSLLLDFKRQLADSLIRKASTTCSRWSQNYIYLGKPKPGPFGFRWHPWAKEILDCEEDWNARKAAQMGFSTMALARSIYTNDILKSDVFYLLPKRSPDATDFSKSKFDAIVDSSPKLATLYTSTRNVGHKQAGPVNMFIRGARSRSGLKTVSASLQVWDELDEMPKKQLALALERSSGYEEDETQLIKISTPTVPDYGIDAEIKLTDQSKFVFKCPSCSRWTDLPFPDCLKIETTTLEDQVGLKNSYVFCPLCKNKLPHETKTTWLGLNYDYPELGAHWEPTVKGFSTRGFCINQYYSTVLPPWRIAETYLKGQFEPSELQEYWNSKGGLAHIPEGARVNDKDFVYGPHKQLDPPPQGHLITMGVDVGKVLHFWIDQWLLPEQLGSDLNMFAKCRNLRHGTVGNFEALDQLMKDYQVIHAVIDWQPETRKAQEFCLRFQNHAHRCYPIRGAQGKMIKKNDDEQIVGVSRTGWLDVSQSRFKNKTILLPQDSIDIAKAQIKNLIRIEKKDEDGHPIAKYISVGADHYAFARYYSEIALPLAVSAGQSKDVSSFL